MRDKLNHFPSASSLMLDLRSSECVTSFTFINTILIPYSALDKCTWLRSPICWSSIIILFREIVLIMFICSSSICPCPTRIMSSSLWKPVILLIINCPAPNYSLKSNAGISRMLGHSVLLIRHKAYQRCIGLIWQQCIIFSLFSSPIIWFHLSEKCLCLWRSGVYHPLLVPFLVEGRRQGNCITVILYQ